MGEAGMPFFSITNFKNSLAAPLTSTIGGEGSPRGVVYEIESLLEGDRLERFTTGVAMLQGRHRCY